MKKIFVIIVIILFVTMMPFSIAMAQSPASDEDQTIPGDSGFAESEIVVKGPGKPPKAGGITPLTTLTGPSPSEYGILTIGMRWEKPIFGWYVWGYSKIQLYGAARKAYAWTELYFDGGLQESTYARKCLAPQGSNCTSETYSNSAPGDFTALSDAFTEVYWSNNSTQQTDDYVTHYFY
ncbi:MAG: hypothetical protein PHQ40_11065 [Anaerolineaceae bacterium]|nr:hypothetical protein [Anaerolineaceae bacterium]